MAGADSSYTLKQALSVAFLKHVWTFLLLDIIGLTF